MRKKITPIPKRLKEAREATDLSQKKLGIAAGIDEFSASARMNQYETGKHTPDYSMLKRIAMALKIPTCYFYTESNQLAEITLAYHSLKKTDQKAALDQIKKLSNNSKRNP